jgi:DNA-binding NtrC family response regulator
MSQGCPRDDDIRQHDLIPQGLRRKCPTAFEESMAKILVIDDEPGIRSLLDTLLSRKGFGVVLADGGQKGLALFRRERPDVVVLDLKMPEMDGVTVLQQIRRLNPDQPVIILTGAGTQEREQQVRALGVTEFIEKEFSLHRLGDALKRLLKAPAPAPFSGGDPA